MKTFLLLLLLSTFNTFAESQKPNIVFIIADDLQACMGSYGNQICKTPNIDRLAKSGVQFDRAYCQYPVCGPSRASLMSGVYPETNGVTTNSYKAGSFRNHNPQLANHPSMAGFFKNLGYQSVRYSKIYHMGVPGEIEAGTAKADDPESWDYASNIMAAELYSPGVSELLTPSRNHYGSNFYAIQVPNQSADFQADALATTQAIAFLENRSKPIIPNMTNGTKSKPGAPFFLALGLVRPHVPLIAPKRCFDLYPLEKIKLPVVPENDLDDIPESAKAMQNEGRFFMSIEQQKKTLAAYYASVTFMDEQVGRVLDHLDRLDMRKNTIVIFTSDHGYNMGEHHCWQKLSLWEETTKVPLIISAPGFEASAGKKSKGIAELIDLYPTLIDLTNTTAKKPSILQGKSLKPLLENPSLKKWDHFAYTLTKGNAVSIRTNDWRYNSWPDGEELYYHRHDSSETTNLAQLPEYSQKVSEFRKKLATKQKSITFKK